jgi:hypothetical protein
VNLRTIALLVALVLLGAGAFVGLAGGDEPLSEMSIEPLGGSVDVLRGDKVIEITEPADLRPDDLIETGKRGARIRLEGQRNVWIGPLSRVVVVDTTTVEDLTGSVLVNAAERTAVRVGDAVASSSNGVFRVDRRVATARAAAYRGDITLVAPGDARTEVPSLYQSSIVAGDIEPPKPYQVAVDDVWDAQWLEEVVALEDELDRLSQGFSNQLKKARLRVADFRQLVGRPVGFMRPYVRHHAPADLFVGYAVAERAPGPTASAFREAFSLREDDGSWGVIAAIMEVESKPLVAGLEKLILDTGVVAGDAPPKTAFAAASEGRRPSRSTGRPSERVTQPPPNDSGEPREQPERPKKKPKEPEDPPEECEGTIDCAAQELPLPDLLDG